MLDKLRKSFKNLTGNTNYLKLESFTVKKKSSLNNINEFYFTDIQKVTSIAPQAIQSLSTPCLFGNLIFLNKSLF